MNEKMRLFFYTIVERYAIFIRKSLLRLPQERWTEDPIYRDFKFCNVNRCLDRTSITLYSLPIDNFGLMALLRFLCSNEMMETIYRGLKNKDADLLAVWESANAPLETFSREQTVAGSAEFVAWQQKIAPFIDWMFEQHERYGVKMVTGAFIVKRYGNDMEQFSLMWYYAQLLYKRLLERKLTTAEEFCMWLMRTVPYVSNFASYCVASDLIQNTELFTDTYDWCSTGPGALAGIEVLYDERCSKGQFVHKCRRLRKEWESHGEELLSEICERTGTTVSHLKALCKDYGFADFTQYIIKPRMLDVEHWLCEYKKYTRGWSKNKYSPTKEGLWRI